MSAHEPGGVYLFRHNDPELWAKFIDRSADVGVPMAVALRKLVAAFVDGRIDIVAANKSKRARRGR